MCRAMICVLSLLLLAIAFPVFAQGDLRDSGSFAQPVALNEFAEDKGSGIQLRVTGLQRGADVSGMDAPGEGQDYASVALEAQCSESAPANCEIFSYDFALAGNMGILYPNLQAADSDAPVVDLAPGETASLTVTALVASDDSNLILLFFHWPTVPFTYPLVFATGAAETESATLAVTASIGMLSRIGPSSDLGFEGVFNRGEQLLAQGRNADGSWLEIAFGWIPAAQVQTDGDIMSLPVTG